jgi:hypothetical protein
MDDGGEKTKARRTVIVLYVVMAAGILVPFLLLWLNR